MTEQKGPSQDYEELWLVTMDMANSLTLGTRSTTTWPHLSDHEGWCSQGSSTCTALGRARGKTQQSGDGKDLLRSWPLRTLGKEQGRGLRPAPGCFLLMLVGGKKVLHEGDPKPPVSFCLEETWTQVSVGGLSLPAPVW